MMWISKYIKKNSISDIMCDFVFGFCLTVGLSVCPSEQVMFGMGFVCLSV